MKKLAELIFVPSPGMGHVVSAMEFSKLLIACDDRIRITVLNLDLFSTPHLVEYTKSVAASEPRIRFIDLVPVDSPSPEILTTSVESFITLTIESHIPSVRDAIAGIVSDSVRVVGLILDFFCVSMIDVGHEFGLPSYIYLPSNAAFLNLMLYLPTRHAQLGTEVTDSDPESPIPGFANSVPPLVLPSAVFNKSGGYEAYMKVAQRFRDAKGIIVNTYAELEAFAGRCFSDDEFQIRNQNPPVYMVGPVLDLKARAQPSTNRTSRDEIMTWLDGQPPASVVFLCFGSMGGFGAPQLKEMAIGLERSGHRFLWSIREPSPAAKALPEGFEERIRGRGVICGWAPQLEVLAHTAIGGFVSHCGWNSILESLWNGVPIVTWPLYAEQQLNAFFMVKELGGLAVELRLGSRMGGDLVVADEIESAVRRLMDGDGEVRKKVNEMGIMARKAVMDGGSSFSSIGRLIEVMVGES